MRKSQVKSWTRSERRRSACAASTNV